MEQLFSYYQKVGLQCPTLVTQLNFGKIVFWVKINGIVVQILYFVRDRNLKLQYLFTIIILLKGGCVYIIIEFKIRNLSNSTLF